MRIALAVWPSTSHLYPVAPLAWALHNAGHEVRVAGHRSLTAATLSAGLTPVPLGGHAAPAEPDPLPAAELDAFEAALAPEPDERHLWQVFRHRVLAVLNLHYGTPTGRGEAAAVDDLVADFAAWRPDLVLWDAAFLAAPVAARACGAAHGRLLWGLDYFGWLWQRSRELAARDPAWRGRDPLTRFVTPLLERYGQQPADEVFVGQWTVDPMPEALRLPLDLVRVPVRHVPYQRPLELPDWLRVPGERPRVLLTAGMFGKERQSGAAVSFDALTGALAGLDAEVVLTLGGQDGAAPALPANIRAVDYVPLNPLLPTCGAVAHHGGFGTFGAALAHGVPQLVSGALSEWDGGAAEGCAGFVAENGAGLALETAGFTAEGLTKGLTELLTDPSHTRGAEKLRRAWLATPGPAEIVPSLLELTARHRS